MTSGRALSRRRALAVIVVALAAVACKQTDAATEPVWGKEPCAHCKMLVSDKRYAAQVVDETGEHRFFDDIGCMVLFMDGRKAPLHSWVRESTSGTWVDARTAKYAQGARTPMDFGFEARADGTLAFDAVRTAVVDKKRGAR
jgi:copper chaperone NosL